MRFIFAQKTSRKHQETGCGTNKLNIVIPAQAEIQKNSLDSRLRGNDPIPRKITLCHDQETIMNYLISISLILAGIIHILPLSGVLSHNQLKQLYGIDFSEPNLAILMRHRAVLFGLLGCFLLWAAFDHAWQILAFIAGFVSILSFIYFAHSVGNYNEKIRRVVMADLIALLALLLGSVSYIFVYH